MQSKHTWLLLPPALALLLVFGPLKTMSQPAEASKPAAGTTEATRTAKKPPIGDALPKMPSLWQVASSLLGVLILGGTVLVLVRRSKTPRPVRAAGAIPTAGLALRQSLRLSPKHKLHLVEFDGKLLMLGSAEQSVALLHVQDQHSYEADEILLRERQSEEGAVPRDMVLPRAKPRPTAPKPARSVTQPQSTQAQPEGSQSETELKRNRAQKSLADFRALLKQVQNQD